VVRDRKATKEQGAPVYKTCERCSGNEFISVKSANAHRAIQMHIPDLHQSSWSRNWKPFYEGLVDIIHKGERQVAAEFEKTTSY
jgi:Antitermination protein.